MRESTTTVTVEERTRATVGEASGGSARAFVTGSNAASAAKQNTMVGVGLASECCAWDLELFERMSSKTRTRRPDSDTRCVVCVLASTSVLHRYMRIVDPTPCDVHAPITRRAMVHASSVVRAAEGQNTAH